jgi:hypothetical protein
MADEISLSISVSVSKDAISIAKTQSSLQDFAGNDYLLGTQAVATTWEAISLGDVTAPPGTVMVKNLDETNYVELALANDGTGIFEKLKPLSVCLFHPTDTTVFAQANTAACQVEFLIIEA